MAFSWVVALAGYATTPAEEMEGICGPAERPEPRQQPAPRQSNTISAAQAKRLFAISREADVPEATVKAILGTFGYSSTKDITRDDYDRVVEAVRDWGAKAAEAEVVDAEAEPAPADADWVDDYEAGEAEAEQTKHD